MQLKVIDISKHQNTYDARKATVAGIDRCMLRIMHGIAGKDNRFDAFAAENKAAGVPYGAYSFCNYIHGKYNNGSVATARQLMQEEMQKLIQLLQNSGVTGWVALDQENEPDYGRWMKLKKSENTQLLNEAGEMLRQAGYEPCLYCSASWVDTWVDVDSLKMPVWVAWYYANETNPDFEDVADFHNLSGHYADLLKEIEAKGRLIGWQFESGSYGHKYGVGSSNIDRSIFYRWPKESEVPMKFNPLAGKQLVCITDKDPECQAFNTTNVNDVVGKLGKDTVYPILEIGPTETISGILGHWFKIEYKPAASEQAYVWVTPDRARIEDVPPEPKPQPQPEPATKAVTVTLNLTPAQLRKLADWMEGEENVD